MINKSYCIENIQYTKEEYAQKLTELHLDTTTGIRSAKEKMGQLVKNCVHKFADLIQCENVTGDNLEEVKDCQHCFDLKGARDSKYSMHGGYGYNDSYDGYGIGANASLMYETVDTGVDESNVAFTIVVYQSTQAYYSINCHFCHNIFGCIGLRNKEYCILNKQYTKEEYEKIVPQIIRHMEVDGSWGEFFSPAISPFAYNETIANDYFPLSREEALRQGFRRLDRESQINIPENAQKINANDLPESISQVDDSILSKVLICEVTGKPYRIIRQELDFYRKHNIPLPHRHQDERHKERMALRTPRKLRDRTCQKCGISIKTSYAPERKEVIYCEQCYNKELYG